MNSRKKLLFSKLGLLGAVAVFAGASSTLAYRGNPTNFSPNYSPERHAQMEKAFETNDYATWQKLMNGRGRVTEVVNENNFSRFAQMHELMEQGKTQEANAIRSELGLGNGQGKGMQKRDGQGRRGENCPFGQTK